MGILVNAAYLMMIEGKRQSFKGTVLQLGRQSVLFSYAMLKNLAMQVEFNLVKIDISNENKFLTDVQFFTLLGFEQVQSMDFGTSEGATYIWDMNHPTPEVLNERFDFIYDGGTLEHIFHIPNAIASVCRMLVIGGRVIHDGGISGQIDHGFYAIQPTLYYDFYKANDFQTDLFTVSKIELAKWLTQTGTQVPYVNGQYDYDKTWAMSSDHFYSAVCFATKLKSFSEMTVPQQSIWSRSE